MERFAPQRDENIPKQRRRLETEKGKLEVVSILQRRFHFQPDIPHTDRAFSQLWNNEAPFTLLERDPHRWMPGCVPALYIDPLVQYIIVWIEENAVKYEYFLHITNMEIDRITKKSEYDQRIG